MCESDISQRGLSMSAVLCSISKNTTSQTVVCLFHCFFSGPVLVKVVGDGRSPIRKNWQDTLDKTRKSNEILVGLAKHTGKTFFVRNARECTLLMALARYNSLMLVF